MTDLISVHADQVRRAKDNIDRNALRWLETRIGFTFVNQVPQKMTISLHPRVATELDNLAGVANLSSSQMIVAALILAFSALPSWKDLFKEDILVLEEHIRIRLALVGRRSKV